MILNNKFIVTIFYLLPFSLITGSFLPDLFVTLIFLFFIFISLKNNNFFINKFVVLFIFFYLVILYSVIIVSPAPILNQGTSIFYIRFGLFSLALIYFFSDKKKLFNFSRIFFFIFIILFIDSLYQFYFEKNLIGLELSHPHRVSSFFGSEWIMGSFISKIFPINLIFISLLNVNKKLKFCLYTIVVVFSLILIFLSGERTSLGMFLFQLIFIFFFIKYNFYKKLILILICLSIIVTIIISIKNQDITSYNRVETKIFNTLQRFEHGIKNFIIFENENILIIPSHKGHYQTAINIFEHNKIFGGGIKSFRHYCKDKKYNFDEGSCSTHPHNVLLLFMSELGLIGFLIYISFLFFLLFDILRKFLKKDSNLINYNNYNRFVIITAGLVSTVLPFLPNGNFFNNYMSILFYLLMGYYLFFRKEVYKN